MVLVCHEHEFIYQKTLKTAGTSVEMALEPLCAPAGHVVREPTPARFSDYGIVGARRGPANEDQTGWRSHLPASKTKALIGDRIWNSYERIAVIRNPFDKAVSWFFWKTRRSNIAPDERVSAFRSFLKDRAERGYFRSDADIDWQTCHLDGRLIINKFLKMETIRADLDELAAGWEIPRETLAMPATKTKVRASDKLPVAAYFDQPSIDILLKEQDWLFRAGRYPQRPESVERASARLVA